MSLTKFSKEQLKEMAMAEVAYELLVEKRQPIVFKDLVAEVASLLELSEKQVAAKISQFYTDLNIDGRYICLGENTWGLRSWYPYEQIEEEVTPVVKTKKKKAKKVEEDLELEDFDEIEEELEYDEEDFDEPDADEFDDDEDLDDDEEFEDEEELLDDEEFELEEDDEDFDDEEDEEDK
ncbi:DNA-directed RNA polymerase subunit delta [Metabacillus fastidiosus]|uniref:DNA-directed RNA polymerase subunit delta n=1 Tax=Metabacillus fastidiosus TaxID=1458 RepID=UPI0008254621|nr:DNA-directed RNA polymerase subunit delta [Metabacillus fastidiosus]MED4464395.1 DNA-directed RNA polymerase subunit delta [Metabacillus fastidiosus]